MCWRPRNPLFPFVKEELLVPAMTSSFKCTRKTHTHSPPLHTHTFSRALGSLQEYHLYMLWVVSVLFVLYWCQVAIPASDSSEEEEESAVQTQSETKKRFLRKTTFEPIPQPHYFKRTHLWVCAIIFPYKLIPINSDEIFKWRKKSRTLGGFVTELNE